MMTQAPTSVSAEQSRRRTPSAARWWSLGGAAALIFVFLLVVDRSLFHATLTPWTEATWWHRGLKSLGTITPWLGAAALMLALGAVRSRRFAPAARREAMRIAVERALLVAASPIVAGAIAEVLKIVIRRERPELHDGAMVFRPWTERPLYGGGLDLPSSHAAVAMGGAAALCIIAPRMTALWLALGLGCGATRMLEGAHFASAVFLGGVIGAACAPWLARALARKPA